MPLYDAIVVGARCAGSPTAMLLARRGHRVLLLDKARFPSDTLSTHLIHPPGVAALQRWGLLDALEATRCPPLTTYSYDFGPFTISGTPAPSDGVAAAYCPRRTVLDKLLVDAAGEAGAEVRERFTVDEVAFEGGHVAGVRGRGPHGRSVTERARCVIGADGRYSLVAKAVRPEQYLGRGMLGAGYHAYWSGLRTTGLRFFIRPGRAFGALPTNADQTLVFAAWPRAEFHQHRGDVERTFMSTLALEPALAEQIRAARREERFRGGSVENFLRRPFGPGWALVGDAGYTKDPCTAFGITDAFLDAERCVAALDQALSGSRSFDDAMANYQRTRDEHALPMYDFTCKLATLEPPPPELRQLLGAAHGDQEAMDRFASMMAGTLPVPAFFARANAPRNMAASTR
jgi:2-polyprenyl-6-methoxyphenol hydroxylase-like FAD-dependent oxidoreductase